MFAALLCPNELWPGMVNKNSSASLGQENKKKNILSYIFVCKIFLPNKLESLRNILGIMFYLTEYPLRWMGCILLYQVEITSIL